MPNKEWRIAGYSRADAAKLMKSGINPLISVLMASRGVTSPEDVRKLTNAELSDISSPFLMKDMDLAAKRVRLAIERGEHVAVYGDYDVDGITSSCLIADYLRSKGISCDIYIPERLEEGYGVKNSALEAIAKKGVSLVITVDCGITAAENKRYAAGLGMDMVITDHHEVTGEMPASPVVDPRRPDCPSPAKMLAGVGVAFKLVCAIEGEEKTEELLERYGDIVAVGTIADVMPMTGENRVYVRRGIELLRSGARPGLRELCYAAKSELKKLGPVGVGYVLAPRINAAGRLGGTDVAVELLITKDDAEAVRLADRLCELNAERRRIESVMVSQALKMLEAEPPNGKPIVLSSSSWHQGVAGIVASRISEKFGLPAIMICVKDGVGRGSCRSSGGYNIFEALYSCRDLLLSFGGHELAAGITVAEEEIPALRRALGEKYLAASGAETEAVLQVDFEVIKPAELLTVENITALDLVEPYGVGNPQPVLCITEATVEDVLPLSDGKHTKLWLSKRGAVFEAVFFSKTIKELGAEKGILANVAFTPQVNEFRGRAIPQLNLCDFVPLTEGRISEE